MCFVPCLVAVVVVAGAAAAQCRTNCTVNKVKIGLDTPRPTHRPLGTNYELRLTSPSLDSPLSLPTIKPNSAALCWPVGGSWLDTRLEIRPNDISGKIFGKIQKRYSIFAAPTKVPNNKLALMNLIHFDLLLAITKSTFVVHGRGLGRGQLQTYLIWQLS